MYESLANSGAFHDCTVYGECLPRTGKGCSGNLSHSTVRAATDSDLLSTRIQNSRSGSVKKICLLKFSAKFWTFKICSEIFDKTFRFKSRSVLKLFKQNRFAHQNCNGNRQKYAFWGVFDQWKSVSWVTRSGSGRVPDPVFRIRGSFIHCHIHEEERLSSNSGYHEIEGQFSIAVWMLFWKPWTIFYWARLALIPSHVS